MAADIVENAPLSIAVMKEELRILAGAHPMSPQGFERVQGLRRIVYDSADYVEGIGRSRRDASPSIAANERASTRLEHSPFPPAARLAFAAENVSAEDRALALLSILASATSEAACAPAA